jgi:hypothetical protein
LGSEVMNKNLIFCLLFAFTSLSFAQLSKQKKLQQLNSRSDIKVTEVEPNLLRLEYPNGKVLIKNIGDYNPTTKNHELNFSPTYDSTIIDLTTIDTMLYYQKYRFWQEVPIHNWDFDHIRIADVNNNGKVELYGPRKFFTTPAEPITVYELNDNGNLDFTYQYDTVNISDNIFDIDKDGKLDAHFSFGGTYGIPIQQRFFSKENDTSIATQLNFIFQPYENQSQLNDQTLGDFDGDQFTDLIFTRSAEPDVHIFEYNPITNNFDSVYRFDVLETAPWGNSGFSIGDFDMDGKTDMVFGTGKGAVYVIENEGNNEYTNSWLGMVETYAAYVHTWTHDIDSNGKPEFWVLGEAYYNEVGITRITLFETNGDNSYQTVGRIDLIGVFSFYAGTIQAVDIDNDGTDEVAVCIDDNFLILKFNGSKDHHTYEVYYIKKNDLVTNEIGSNYYGAIMCDLFNDNKKEILISMNHIIYQQNIFRMLTRIYKPDSATIVNETIPIPSKDILQQNYPNPFNPSTTIKYVLSEKNFVSLKVYDILGREVKTLVNEIKEAGTYSIEFNASELPSGVYFYTLTSGNFLATKKLILLK